MVAAAAVSAFCLTAAADDLPESPDGPHRQRGPFHVKYAKEFSSKWQPDDPVEIFYGEFLLAQWVLDRAPWNAYHSALGFKNSRTDTKCLFDFTPIDTSSVMNMVMPHIHMQSLWRALLFGDWQFEYKDGARTEFFDGWPQSYTNFVRVGQTNGTAFQSFVDWVIHDFAPRHGAFQPIEVADVNLANSVNVSNVKAAQMTIVRSRMCHDFVTDSLWFFYEAGATLKADDLIFRDHIIMYADTVKKAGPFIGHTKRRFGRYWRAVGLFLDGIKSQFTFARTALLIGWKLGIPVFLHDEWQDYEIQLAPPFLNYCYLPLAIPPQMYNPFAATKLCALGMQANVTNETAPLPWGPLLAAEERLDHPVPKLSLAAVVLAVAVVSTSV